MPRTTSVQRFLSAAEQAGWEVERRRHSTLRASNPTPPVESAYLLNIDDDNPHGRLPAPLTQHQSVSVLFDGAGKVIHTEITQGNRVVGARSQTVSLKRAIEFMTANPAKQHRANHMVTLPNWYEMRPDDARVAWHDQVEHRRRSVTKRLQIDEEETRRYFLRGYTTRKRMISQMTEAAIRKCAVPMIHHWRHLEDAEPVKREFVWAI